MPILVVEDDPSMGAMLQAVLEGEGYEVLSTQSGQDALGMVRIESVDLILLDALGIGMCPDDFVTECQRLPGPTPPLVLTSGHADGDTLAREIGAAAFLAKPYELDDLLHTVAAHAQRN